MATGFVLGAAIVLLWKDGDIKLKQEAVDRGYATWSYEAHKEPKWNWK